MTRLALGIILAVAIAGCSASHDGAAPGGGGTTGSSGGGGSAGGVGTGGNGPTPTPPAPSCTPGAGFTGAPISEANANVWTWIPFAGALCKDGSTTGIGVRIRPGSTRLAIYLEGGGACFHPDSCNISALFSSFSESSFNSWTVAAGNGGIFDAGNSANPFADYSMVYVPYCTGDVHAGNAEHVDVPGAGAPTNQMFVGYRNIGLYLQRLVPTFPEVDHVVLTGISAGGIGAAYNYDRVAQAFCGRDVTLVDDSGPPMTDTYLAPCLQQRWRDLWNLKDTLPADCAACTGPDGGGIVNYLSYIIAKYPAAKMSLISSNMDGVISTFYGYGSNDCQGLTGASAGMSGTVFQEGLEEVRSQYLTSSPNLGSYIIASTQHTWLNPLSFYGTTVSGISLPAWTNLIINQGISTHVDP